MAEGERAVLLLLFCFNFVSCPDRPLCPSVTFAKCRYWVLDGFCVLSVRWWQPGDIAAVGGVVAWVFVVSLWDESQIRGNVSFFVTVQASERCEASQSPVRTRHSALAMPLNLPRACRLPISSSPSSPSPSSCSFSPRKTTTGEAQLPTVRRQGEGEGQQPDHPVVPAQPGREGHGRAGDRSDTPRGREAPAQAGACVR